MSRSSNHASSNHPTSRDSAVRFRIAVTLGAGVSVLIVLTSALGREQMKHKPEAQAKGNPSLALQACAQIVPPPQPALVAPSNPPPPAPVPYTPDH
jgi:hypothetical protein